MSGSFLSTHGDGGLGEGGGGGGDGGGGDGGGQTMGQLAALHARISSGAFDGAVGLARHDLGIIPTPGPELGSGATLAA